MLILSQRLISFARSSKRAFSAKQTSAAMVTPPFCKINPLPRSSYPASIVHSAQDLRRIDEGLDFQWYSIPRFVNHIDDGCIATLKEYYGSIIKPNHSVIDLCSSWVSHMPDNLKPQNMIGYGMNKQELARNGHLTRFFVKDLNTTPNLEEVSDSSTDIVICSVSVDYLTQPVSVFKELHRVLKNGGQAHMAFSNRCFPTKVIGKWMQMSDEERRHWVGGYFWASGEWEDVEEVILKGGKGGLWAHEDPLFVVRARKAGK